MNLRSAQEQVREVLSRGKNLSESSDVLTEEILKESLHLTAADLVVNADQELDAASEEKLFEFARRKSAGEPFQYVVGKAPFWEHEFSVGSGVLIPRPETEILVEECIKEIPFRATVVELGGGSGCIPVSVLESREDLVWHSFEISPFAFKFLQKNVETLARTKALSLWHGDFFEQADAIGSIDAVIANPPYIPRRELATLPAEVQCEPIVALDGGDFGLEIIERLVNFSARRLSKNGLLISEIDYRQGPAATDLCIKAGFTKAEVRKDLSGKDRVLVARM